MPRLTKWASPNKQVNVPLYDSVGPDAVRFIINHASLPCGPPSGCRVKGVGFTDKGLGCKVRLEWLQTLEKVNFVDFAYVCRLG